MWFGRNCIGTNRSELLVLPPQSTTAIMEKQDQFLRRTSVTLIKVLSTPTLQAALAEHTYDLPKIREGMRLHDTVEDLTLRSERAQAAQHQTSQLLREAKAELHAWMCHFDKVARLAFNNQPQQLEALGQDVC